MNAVERNRLSLEAKMQMKALRQIGWWKTIALALSAVGAALIYAGFAGNRGNLFLGVPGIILAALGILSAAVFNLGLKNGRRNVEKMLNVLEGRGIS